MCFYNYIVFTNVLLALNSVCHKLSVLSTSGACHPEGFILASYYNLTYIANNHDINNNNNDENNNKLSKIPNIKNKNAICIFSKIKNMQPQKPNSP